MPPPLLPDQKSVAHLALGFLYMFIAAAGTLLSGFIFRDTYRFALIQQQLHRYTIHVNVLFLTFLIGTCTLIALVVLEHYFRTAPDWKTQLRRFLRVMAFPLLLASLAQFSHIGLAVYATGFVDGIRLATGIAKLILGVLLIAFTRGRHAAAPGSAATV